MSLTEQQEKQQQKREAWQQRRARELQLRCDRAEQYMEEAKKRLDATHGKGYAAKHIQVWLGFAQIAVQLETASDICSEIWDAVEKLR